MKNNQELEIEKRFLLAKIPDEIAGIRPHEMLDIYLPAAAAHKHLRLRQKDDKFVITKKEPLDPADLSTMVETTIPLTRDEFDCLAQCDGARVAKDRYNVQLGGYDAEVGIFREALEGLGLVDFEFANADEMAKFVPPAGLFLADVTDEKFLAGGVLAGKSYADIAEKLAKFGYKKLGENA